jgi:hypothetical protein
MICGTTARAITVMHDHKIRPASIELRRDDHRGQITPLD